MNRRILYAIWFLGIIHFFTFNTSSAQIVIQRNLNIEDGLVYSQVLSTFQDQKGYLWIGTSNGLSRWDGNQFKNYVSTNKISFDNIKMMTETNNGNLFIATGSGILISKNGEFIKPPNYPSSLETSINQLIKSRDGIIYIAAEDSGLWQYENYQFTKIPILTNHNKICVTSLAFTGDDILLVGTKLNGLFAYKNKQIQTYNINGKPFTEDINFVYQDVDRSIYIGSNENGLYRIDRKHVFHFNRSNGLPDLKVNCIYKTSDGQIYIATKKGLAIIQNEKIIDVINTEKGLSNNFVWCVNEDKQGNVYFGTDGGGIDIYRPGVFKTYNESCGLPNNTVWNISESSDNKFYLSTDEGVAVLHRGEMDIITTKHGLSDNMIITVFESSKGEIFFGTNDFGADILKNGRFKNLNKLNGLTSNSVWSIIEDQAGRIYFGTYDGGICVYKNGQVIDTIGTDDGLANNYIVSAYKLRNESIYFGLDAGGVYEVKDGKLNKEKVILPGITVWAMYQNKSGDLYFGTDKNGLICISQNKTDTISTEDGLSNNTILGILEDNTGKLYLTTDNGLNVLDFKNGKPVIRIITNEDGLASNECNQGAYLKDSNGLFWIGTIRGVTCYNPQNDKPSYQPPLTHITNVKLFNKGINIDSMNTSYQFKYDENYLNFNFIGIDLKAPHKVTYAYRLKGIKQDWVATNNPNVQYANLDDNDYTFEVKSCNEWGIWSEPVTLKFSILPPFWETWWFRLIVIICIGGLFGLLIYLRLRNLLIIERVRTKIAADLHDDIGAGLSEINILSAVAETKMPNELKNVIGSELNNISKIAGKMIDNMSDIIWMVNPKKDSMTDLVSRLKDSYNDVLDAKNIRFHSENSSLFNKIKLDMEKRQIIFLIFKEAINNAIKYSDCKNLNLKIEIERKNLRIILDDDGTGFDKSNIIKGNGLNNMKMRAEKIKASLIIDSKTEKGTSINLSVKI